MQKRDFSIDVLKFLAAILITNSHMDLLYGDYSYLATGGALGDSLFFFCSGYTLFLGRDASFFNWYKRRINRIYPTIFAWAIACCAIWSISTDFLDILVAGGGWFIKCLMIYYAVLWFVKRYCRQRLGAVFILASAIIFVRFYIGGGVISGANVYEDPLRYWMFFLTMLAGAMLGVRRNTAPYNPGRAWVNLLMLVACAVVFYAMLYFGKREGMALLQVFTVFPMVGFAEYFYRLCNCRLSRSLYDNRITGPVIKCIGGLCLEIYLVQFQLFTDKMNSIFPLNLFVIFLIIIAGAYILRCASRIWKQTFSDSNYDWKEIVNPY